MHRVFMLLVAIAMSNSLLHALPEPEQWCEEGFGIEWWKKGLHVNYQGACASADGKYAFAKVLRTDTVETRFEIQMWDLEQKQLVKTIDPEVVNYDIFISPDGKTLMGQHRQNAFLEFIDVESGESLWYGMSENNGGMFTTIIDAAFIEETGDAVVYTKDNQFLEIINPRSHQQQYKVEIGNASFYSGCFSENGTYFAGSFRDTTLKIFNSVTGNKELEIKTDTVLFVYAISNDAKHIVFSKYAQQYIYTGIMNVETGEVVKGFLEDIHCAEFSTDSKNILLYGSGFTVPFIFNMDTPNIIRRGAMPVYSESISFIPNSSEFIGTSTDRALVINDAADVGNFEKLKLYPENTHFDNVSGLAVSHDNSLLATCSYDGLVKIWDAQTGEIYKTMDVGEALIDLEYSKDNKRLTAASSSRLYTFSTDNYIMTAQIDNAIDYLVTDIEFQPGSDFNEITVCGWFGSVYSWTLGGGTPRKIDTVPEYVKCVAWSPDGYYLAAGTRDKKVRLYQYYTTMMGSEYNNMGEWTAEADAQFSAQGMVDLEFSPDGSTLLTLSEGEMMPRLWKTEDHTLIRDYTHEFDYPQGPTKVVKFLAEGQKIAMSGLNGIIHVWDTETGEYLYKFDSVGSYYSNKESFYTSAFALSPDGESLFVATTLGDIIKLDVSMIPISVAGKEKQPEITVGPNPCSNFVNISCPAELAGELTVVISDLQGRIVLSDRISAPGGMARINVSRLGAGVYSMQIINGRNSSAARIIKQ